MIECSQQTVEVSQLGVFAGNPILGVLPISELGWGCLSVQPTLSSVRSYVDILGVSESVLSLKSKPRIRTVSTRGFQISRQGELLFTSCPSGPSPAASSTGRVERWGGLGHSRNHGLFREDWGGVCRGRGSRCTPAVVSLTLCLSPHACCFPSNKNSDFSETPAVI